jgi:hypothetical protein
MTDIERAGDRERRRAALEWLAEQAGWEIRLDELRRPRRGRPTPTRRRRPDADLRHAS